MRVANRPPSCPRPRRRRIRGADIGDVHHMIDAIAIQLQRTHQPVLKQVSAQVPDMGVVVDRRSAGIEPPPRPLSAA